MDFFESVRKPLYEVLNLFFLFQKMSFAPKIYFQKKKLQKYEYWRLYPKIHSPPPPKICIKFFLQRLKIEKNLMCLMCANTLSSQNDVRDGHRCPCFQPFLNWTFPRGDTSTFSKKVLKFCRIKWGGDGFGKEVKG